MSDLARPFGLWTATAMVVGGMIGAGIFVLPAALAPFGWAGAASWIVAGAGSLTIARIIAEFAIRRPHEPSILTICGDILGLLPGRLLTWSYWGGSFVALPILALTAAAYLLHLFPGDDQGPWPRALLGTVILVLLASANLRGAREAGQVQVATTALKLVPLAIVILIVAWLFASTPQIYTHAKVAPFSFPHLTPALAITFFAMISFENASLVAERVEDPARNVPRATLLGLGATLIVYVIVSTGISFAVPPDDLARDSAPIATFVARYLGRWPGDAVALFASISAIGCLNATVVLLGELPLGLVRDGQLPEWMAPTNRHDVAARPLLFGCALGLALMLASTSGMGERVLDFLLRLTTASTLWLYVGVCIAGLMAGTMRAMAVIGLCFCAWVLYSAGLEAGGLSVLLLVAGVPMHFLMGGRTPSAIAA